MSLVNPSTGSPRPSNTPYTAFRIVTGNLSSDTAGAGSGRRCALTATDATWSPAAGRRKSTNAEPLGGKSSVTTVLPFSVRHSGASAIVPFSASQISGCRPATRKDASKDLDRELLSATKYQSAPAPRRWM